MSVTCSTFIRTYVKKPARACALSHAACAIAEAARAVPVYSILPVQQPACCSEPRAHTLPPCTNIEGLATLDSSSALVYLGVTIRTGYIRFWKVLRPPTRFRTAPQVPDNSSPALSQSLTEFVRVQQLSRRAERAGHDTPTSGPDTRQTPRVVRVG